MAYIDIDIVTFNSALTTIQTVTVAYKLTSAADIPLNYTIVTTNLQVNTNGIPVGGPYRINGLTLGQSYTVKISNNCNGIGFTKNIVAQGPITTTTSTSSTTTTTTTLPPTTTTTTTSSTTTTTTSTICYAPTDIESGVENAFIDGDGAYFIDGDGSVFVYQ